MKLALIGVGQAGGKIVDRFLEYDLQQDGPNSIRAALAVNTAKADLMGLEHVPEDQRLLIGQTQVKGHGVGADNELGAEVAQNDIHEVQNAVNEFPVHEIDAFMIIAGLGGGTGSGGAPVIARELDDIYTEPIYGLGILPATNEGGIYTLNAARSFQTFVDEVECLLVFDNDAWRESGESIQDSYATINDELVNRFGALFTAGEYTGDEQVAESVVDSSEIINTLANGGVASVGYAVDEVDPVADGLLSRLSPFGSSKSGTTDGEAVNRITSLVQKATRGRLTLPGNVESVERALLLVSGPDEYLSRKGIEEGRTWIEEETGSMEVRGGDNPTTGQQVTVTVLLAGLTDVPRIKELQQIAIEAQENIDDIRAESDEKLDELVDDGTDELDPLF